MKPLRNKLKQRRWSILGADLGISSFNPVIDEIVQWRSMHMELCRRVSETNSKPTQHWDQQNEVERFQVMDPLPLFMKFFRRHSYRDEHYPQPQNWLSEKSRKSMEKSPKCYFLSSQCKSQIDDRVSILNEQKCSQSSCHLGNIILQTSGGDHCYGNRMDGIPSQLRANHPSKCLRYPVDVAPHQFPGEPPRRESIDFERLSRRNSSQADLALQEVIRGRLSKQNGSQMARNTQEINFERSSRRNSQHIERNILESYLECSSRGNNYQTNRGAQEMNSEHCGRRNSNQFDRIPHEVNNERPSRRNSYQRERNQQEFNYERSGRRNSNLIDRNMLESNFERNSRRNSNQVDIILPQYEADRPLRRNSKQMDMIPPMCHPDRSGRRNSNALDDAFRQCPSDPTSRRGSVLMDKGFRNFNSSRWEIMAGSKPTKPPAPQRPKQKDVGPTDKNTKPYVPKRSSRWETMNIDKLHDPANNPVNREANTVKRDAKGPIPKKATPKRTAQWEQVDRSLQIFNCEQEVHRDPIYQKRGNQQYTSVTNRTERMNRAGLETSSKFSSGQWQRSLKPVAGSKIAGGDSRWETVRLFDSPSTTQPQTLNGEIFQPCRQPALRPSVAGASAQQETILIDHRPNASPSVCQPLDKPLQSNPSHNASSIGKTVPRLTTQDCLPPSGNSVSVGPLLPDNRMQKEFIHGDYPLKNTGVSTADPSSRGTAFSANEDRPDPGGVRPVDRGFQSRAQLEADCEVVAMERSFAGEANLADGYISTEPPM